MPKPYRSRIRLVLDILRAVQAETQSQDHALVTRLLAMANLTHPRLLEHLQELVAKGWIEETDLGDRRGWKLTPSGTQALGELQRVAAAIEDFGLSL